jgi:hypothetical protein
MRNESSRSNFRFTRVLETHFPRREAGFITQREADWFRLLLTTELTGRIIRSVTPTRTACLAARFATSEKAQHLILNLSLGLSEWLEI